MANIKVDVVNESTVVTDAQVQSLVTALQTQIHRDFAPSWGIDADLKFISQGSSIEPGAWQLVVLDDSDQAGALGYHELTSDGMPLAKAFAGSDMKAGLEWTVTVSHELLEMLADPDINLAVFVQQTNTSGVLYAYEACDACEDDSFGYTIDGSLLSDFVFPSWFESFRQQGSTQFDYGKHITKPFEILQGGYIATFDVTSGSGWKQITSYDEYPRLSQIRGRMRLDSRYERRRLSRDKWKRSEKHR
jgi:hypothetical protein